MLVLSNSLGTTLEMWDDQVPALAERFRVLRYDQRGHGRSPAPPGPYAIADLGARRARAARRARPRARVASAAVSLGGMVGHVAGDQRARAASTGWCSAARPRTCRRASMWTERAATVREQGIEAIVEGALERWFTPALAERRPEVAGGRAPDAARPSTPEGYAGCCEAIARPRPARPRSRGSQAPTLVIAGADDPATPPEHGARDRRRASPARALVVLDRRRPPRERRAARRGQRASCSTTWPWSAGVSDPAPSAG